MKTLSNTNEISQEYEKKIGEFTRLEVEVVCKILEKNLDTQIFRNQFFHSRLKERKFTGVGFFTEFDIQEDMAINSKLSSPIGNIGANIKDLKHGAGFVLFLKNGYIHSLEGFTYDEPWPEKISQFELFEIKEINSSLPLA